MVPYGHFQKSSGSMEPLEPPLTEPLQYVISLKVNYFELDYVLKSHLIYSLRRGPGVVYKKELM